MRRRLRTTTGCLRCKARRKKCDESKPTCGSCQRWNLTCIWKQSADTSMKTSQVSMDISGIPQSMTAHGVTKFRDQAQLDLLCKFGSIYRGVTSPITSNDFSYISRIVTIALKEEWVRDSLNAFTAKLLYFWTLDKKLEEHALSSYQMAVVGLKKRLYNQVHHGEELFILLAATFLGVFEAAGMGNADLSMTHFTLVAKLGRIVFARPCSDRTTLAVYRVILEHTIYELMCNSLFHPVPDMVLPAINWEDHTRIFSPLLNDPTPAYQLSPFAGGNCEFFLLILEITAFSRQPHDQVTRSKQVDSWRSQLHHLEQRLHTYYDGAPADLASIYKAKYQLYGLALHIYCLKIEDHQLHATHWSVTKIVQAAQKIFMQSASHKVYASSIVWPLVVFLCACPDLATFKRFIVDVESIKTRISPGHLRNLEAIMTELRGAYQRPAVDDPAGSNDGLGALLCKDGINEAFFRALRLGQG